MRHIADIGEYLTPFFPPDILRRHIDFFPGLSVYDFEGLDMADIVSLVERAQGRVGEEVENLKWILHAALTSERGKNA